MLLVELFKTDIDLQILTNRPKECMLSFTINEKEYRFMAYVDNDISGDGNDWWDVSFGLRRNSITDYDITKTGDAIQVFSAVTQCLKKLIELYPEMKHISFTAKKSEPSRVKLYNRMLSAVKLTGWRSAWDASMFARVYYLHKVS